jgi:hypothetical protein
MPFDEDKSRQFDEAAEKAMAELREHFDAWSARDLSAWWSRWYLKAGHKRLGRILVTQSKQRN